MCLPVLVGTVSGAFARRPMTASLAYWLRAVVEKVRAEAVAAKVERKVRRAAMACDVGRRGCGLRLECRMVFW